jgi:hypothetical protein
MLAEIFLMRLQTMLWTAAAAPVAYRTRSRFVPIALARS